MFFVKWPSLNNKATLHFISYLFKVCEDRTGHPSMGMAAAVGVNESLQVQRKLDGFLAAAPKQTGTVGAASDTETAVSTTYHNMRGLNAVSNEVCTSLSAQ